MPRYARQKCASGIYHVMVRGINRQNIFHDEEDCQRFLETIERIKSTDIFALYGYCLMGNHVHLLLHAPEDGPARIMKRLGISYAWWYNQKYDRVGHVFQDRYKSENIEDDKYILSVLRYMHSNPVKAQMVVAPDEYRWSSCRIYYGSKEYPAGLTNTTYILDMFAEEEESARKRFKEYSQQENREQFLDIETKERKSDNSLHIEIQKILAGQPVTILQVMGKQERDEILRDIKRIDGATQRQIARVTGINASIIFKA